MLVIKYPINFKDNKLVLEKNSDYLITLNLFQYFPLNSKLLFNLKPKLCNQAQNTRLSLIRRLFLKFNFTWLVIE